MECDVLMMQLSIDLCDFVMNIGVFLHFKSS